MKRLTIFSILYFLYSAISFGQQKPQYTQYLLNGYLLNPAFTGIENFADVKLGYRHQWNGIEGAPLNTYLTGNLPLGDVFLNGGVGSGNPSYRSYKSNYIAAEPHHGLGAQIMVDRAGLITQTDVNASYAYHIGLTTKLNIAIGATVGLSQYALNTSLITIESLPDPAINNNSFTRWNPTLSIGSLIYGEYFFLGASVQQLLSQKLFSGQFAQKSRTISHYFIMGGMKIPLLEDVFLTPSSIVKVIDPVPLTFDFNLKLSYREQYWIGGGYRKNDSFSVLLGFNLNDSFNIGYSYDMNTNSFNINNNGSHEIVLGIQLGNKYHVKCPQHGF